LGGIAITAALLLFDPLIIVLLCVLYLIAFWIWGKRISFAILGVLLLFLLTRSRFATIGAVLIFTFGDGFAAVIGSRYGAWNWPWHRQKTIEGSAAFFIASFLVMGIYIYLVLPEAGGLVWLMVSAPVFIGCILECLPIQFIRDRKPDDNLILILATGFTLYVLQIKLGLSSSLHR
jgi:dolichol kinase